MEGEQHDLRGLGGVGRVRGHFLRAATPKGGTWTPASITTALWLDAADAATVTTVSGAVSQWNDKSGNNRHAVQATQASQPSATANTINSKTVITFDGSNDFMDVSTTVLQGQTEPNLFYVFVYYGSGSGGPYFPAVSVLPSAGQDRGVFHYVKSTSNLGASYPLFGADPYWGNYDLSSGTVYVTGTPEIIGFNALAGNWRVFRNGVQEGATGTVGGAPDNTFTGLRLAQQLNPLRTSNIGIGELVFTFGASVLNCQKMEGYLAHKWGLTANLPSNHPYKTVAP